MEALCQGFEVLSLALVNRQTAVKNNTVIIIYEDEMLMQAHAVSTKSNN